MRHRCLGDRTLFLLSEGEGTSRQRQHLAACADCRARYHSLTTVGELAGRVLLEGPWPDEGAERTPVLGWLVPAGAALAAALVLAWLGVSGRGLRLEPTTAPPGVAYAALSLDDVSSTLFAADDGVWRPEQDADEASLQAALEGEWPCDGADRLLDTSCD
jgi:hypothetical protein